MNIRNLIAVTVLQATFFLAAPQGLVAGSTTGVKSTVTAVNARGRDTFKPVTFVGGEVAAVVVSGDGDTDLDLYVFDENGTLVASDDDGTDECRVSFIPRRTGRFTIVVVNRGNVYNRYVLATN